MKGQIGKARLVKPDWQGQIGKDWCLADLEAWFWVKDLFADRTKQFFSGRKQIIHLEIK